MYHGLRWRAVETLAAACAIAIALTVSGCSPLTPSIKGSNDASSKGSVIDSALVSSGTLTVGLISDDAPQAMSGTGGRLQGYTVDVARAIAEQLGLNVSFVSASSAAGALDGRRVDVFLGAAPTGAHDAVDSAGAYLSSAISLFGKAKGAAKPSAADLSSASIGVQRASASAGALESSTITGSATAFKNVNECFDALERGKIDYVACDATAGAYLARRYADISFIGTIGAARKFEVLLRSTDLALSKQVRSIVKKLSGNGMLEAIHTQWYGDLPMDLGNRLISGVTGDASADTGSSGGGDEAPDDASAESGTG